MSGAFQRSATSANTTATARHRNRYHRNRYHRNCHHCMASPGKAVSPQSHPVELACPT